MSKIKNQKIKNIFSFLLFYFNILFLYLIFIFNKKSFLYDKDRSNCKYKQIFLTQRGGNLAPTNKRRETVDNYTKGTTLAVVESFRGAYSVRGYKVKELYLVTARGVKRVFSTEKEAREYLDVHVVGRRGVVRRIPCLVLDR